MPHPEHELLVVRRPGRPPLDLGRDTYALLGLVFDAVTLDGAVAALLESVEHGRRCFVSTPNVNFVATAQRDRPFRQSVLRSDLSLADGMPIVWAARLVGLPIHERVAGSDLFQALRDGPRALRVYFFGGPDGVAQRACERLAADAGRMRCVGFDAPGFGSVEAMSGSDRLDRINASGTEFLVVALGAKKGQAWIEHNLDRLRPMAVSHLGAVVNFVAGSVARAPRAVARLGLEWLWRIGQEPALWRRYARDGLRLAHLMATQVLPLALALRRQRASPSAAQQARITSADRGAITVLKLGGAWCAEALPSLREALAKCLREGQTVQLDLTEVTAVDAGFVALLLRVDCWQGSPGLLDTRLPVPPGPARIFRLCGASDLLSP